MTCRAPGSLVWPQPCPLSLALMQQEPLKGEDDLPGNGFHRMKANTLLSPGDLLTHRAWPWQALAGECHAHQSKGS